jgi:hypothetical protein
MNDKKKPHRSDEQREEKRQGEQPRRDKGQDKNQPRRGRDNQSSMEPRRAR